MAGQALSQWGLYPWFSTGDQDLVHPDDRARFAELEPYGLLFKMVADEGEYLVLAYGQERFRVKPDLWKETGPCAFEVGQQVSNQRHPEKTNVVREVMWHYKHGREFYLLTVDGKKKTRRYWAQELAGC